MRGESGTKRSLAAIRDLGRRYTRLHAHEKQYILGLVERETYGTHGEPLAHDAPALEELRERSAKTASESEDEM